MAAEVERWIIELGAEGRLIEMQLEELVHGVFAERAALVRDYAVDASEPELETGDGGPGSSSATTTSSTSVASPSTSATTARPTPLTSL